MNCVISPLQSPRAKPSTRTAASTAGVGQAHAFARIPSRWRRDPPRSQGTSRCRLPSAPCHADHGDCRNGGLLQDHRRIVHIGEILHKQAGDYHQRQEDGRGRRCDQPGRGGSLRRRSGPACSARPSMLRRAAPRVCRGHCWPSVSSRAFIRFLGGEFAVSVNCSAQIDNDDNDGADEDVLHEGMKSP